MASCITTKIYSVDLSCLQIVSLRADSKLAAHLDSADAEDNHYSSSSSSSSSSRFSWCPAGKGDMSVHMHALTQLPCTHQPAVLTLFVLLQPLLVESCKHLVWFVSRHDCSKDSSFIMQCASQLVAAAAGTAGRQGRQCGRLLWWMHGRQRTSRASRAR